MTKLLLSRFLKSDDMETPDARARLGTLSGVVGIVLNLLLFGGKLLAGLFSASIAILADAFNNLSDAASSLVTLVGFRISGKQPDSAHPFGHGRAEYLAGLFVSVAILLVAVELGKSAVEKILSPEPVLWSLPAVVILAVSIFAKLWLFLFNRALSRLGRSSALAAVAKDSVSDAASTGAVLLGTLLTRFFGWQLDGWLGLLVALFIFYTGVTAIRDTMAPLLGTRTDPALAREITGFVMEHDGVNGVHDLLVHDYGPGRKMISLHVEVSRDGDLVALHDMIDNIEQALSARFACEAVIHMDPLAVGDAATEETRARIGTLLHLIDPGISLHDFRMVPGPTHTNLIFDVVAPFRFRLSDEQLQRAIAEGVRALDPAYRTVVRIDRPY